MASVETGRGGIDDRDFAADEFGGKRDRNDTRSRRGSLRVDLNESSIYSLPAGFKGATPGQATPTRSCASKL